MSYMFRILMMVFAMILSPLALADREQSKSNNEETPVLQASHSVYRTWLTKELPTEKIELAKIAAEIAENPKFTSIVNELENNKYLSTDNGGVLFKYKDKYYETIAQGTSYAIAENGVMASNWHVVVHESIPGTIPFLVEQIDPLFKVHKGKIKWSNEEKDLSLTEYENFNPKPLSLDVKHRKQGDKAYAIGFPGLSDVLSGHLEDPTSYVTPGITNGLLKKEAETNGVKYWEHNADINHGNSGGPLVDECGTVVGTNESGITSSSGFYRAVRSEELVSVLEKMNEYKYTVAEQACDPTTIGGSGLSKVTSNPKMLYIGLGMLGLAILGLILFAITKGKKATLPPPIPTPDPLPTSGHPYLDPNGRRYKLDEAGNYIYLDDPNSVPEASPVPQPTPVPTPTKTLNLRGLNGSPSINLEVNRAVKIGRSNGCDVIISNGKISGTHAEILYDGTNVFITDLNSTNGTYVNGHKVSSRQLVNQDSKISLTQDDLAVWNYGNPRASASKTVGMMPVGSLISLNGQSRDMKLTTNSTIRIGRNASNDVVLNSNDKEVSSKHCKLEISGNGIIRLIDTQSTNGTFYQSMNNRVSDTVLHNGDVFYLAKQDVGFKIVKN